ncbi:MAG: hypothetical protein ACE5EM_01120 [Sphingomonadales bacterium]
MSIEKITHALQAIGLTVMGAFHPDPADKVPPCANGAPARTLVLAGNVGPAMWQAFSSAGIEGPHPLDQWLSHHLPVLATELGATPLLISQGPPYLPFQRWARRAGPYYSSPLGILIHPVFGLWHGFRGALAFPEQLTLPPRDDRPGPCASCREKPCLDACPVGAFTSDGYHVAACIDHLHAPQGHDCLDRGCRARRACPVGRDYIYKPAQARHHMTAFLRANG